MCIHCGAHLKPGVTEYIEKQGNVVIIIRNVPCEECVQCGETFFSDTTVKALESILNSIQHIASEITVTVIDYRNDAA